MHGFQPVLTAIIRIGLGFFLTAAAYILIASWMNRQGWPRAKLNARKTLAHFALLAFLALWVFLTVT